MRRPKLPKDWTWTQHEHPRGRGADWRPDGRVGGYVSDDSENGWRGVAMGYAADRATIRIEVHGFGSFRDAMRWVEEQGEIIGTMIRKLIRGKGLVKMEVDRSRKSRT